MRHACTLHTCNTCTHAAHTHTCTHAACNMHTRRAHAHMQTCSTYTHAPMHPCNSTQTRCTHAHMHGMRAHLHVQVQCKGAGDPSRVLSLSSSALPPELEWGCVLVHMAFTSINPADLYSVRLGGVRVVCLQMTPPADSFAVLTNDTISRFIMPCPSRSAVHAACGTGHLSMLCECAGVWPGHGGAAFCRRT